MGFFTFYIQEFRFFICFTYINLIKLCAQTHDIESGVGPRIVICENLTFLLIF